MYNDVVEEADEAVGTLMAALARLRLARDTLVIATSDNGPWYEATAGQREREASTFEEASACPSSPAGRRAASAAGGARAGCACQRTALI